MDRKEAVAIFLEDIKKAYIKDQTEKNIRASGKSASMFKDSVDETGGKLFGADYVYFQKKGRKPGGMPPIEAIIEWLKNKTSFRVDNEKGPSLEGLAFAIARKIAKKGTDIHQGKRPGLSIEDKMLEARKKLRENLVNIAKAEILEKLKIIKS